MGSLFRTSESINRSLDKSPYTIEVTPGVELIPTAEVRPIVKRHVGDKNLSPELQTLIALTSVELGPKRTAEVFNVTRSKASSLGMGVVSDGECGRQFDEGLRAKVIEKKSDINKRAIDLLFDGLATVTSMEMANTDLVNRVKVLKGLSDIAEKTTPADERGTTSRAMIIIAPSLVNIDSLEMLLPETA